MNRKIYKKILLIGSGGIQVGQAGEFDYSGSQAIKALKEENIEIILLNPNIATVQTDSCMADKVYLEPLNLDVATSIIKKERPDGVLLGFGGQTALNLGLSLDENGIFSKYKVDILGNSIKTIRISEDRQLFKNALEKIGIKTAKGGVASNILEALKIVKHISFPIMIRSNFSLGGMGAKVVANELEFIEQINKIFNFGKTVFVEESLLGWEEFEYEIVRDIAGNKLTICNMENLDPVGIHTGDSIVVTPSQTLSNKEYHLFRHISLNIADALNIIGECNIQFAYNRQSKEYRIIELNPRLSRSSALASKATGYPLAFVATKLSLGFKLSEIKNNITQQTFSFFEPALDYVAVKIPRWDLEKLKECSHIGTGMRSIGEVMGIGRTFAEALQKAIAMLNIPECTDLSNYSFKEKYSENFLTYPTSDRLFLLYQYFLKNGTIEKAHSLSKINMWFLTKIKEIAETQKKIITIGLNRETLKIAKLHGFSDKGIAQFFQRSEKEIRVLRIQYNVQPFIKQIDTLAGEFNAKTNYLYMTYHGNKNDISKTEKKSIVVLGAGPYSIGTSVEFDWCCVNAVKTLRELNYSTIIINSNPETVSTDYDESDRLYFEALTFERVSDILNFETPESTMVSFGGQIANNLSFPLSHAGYKILGTTPKNINKAEDRILFSELLDNLGISQPAWSHLNNLEKIKKFAEKNKYPILIRPSFVLSGSGMCVIQDETMLNQYMTEHVTLSNKSNFVISKFFENSTELDVDGIAGSGKVLISFASEHLEKSGVHSGDSIITFPTRTISNNTRKNISKIVNKIINALHITGPFNIQFLITPDNDINVIECNLRASRLLPFLAKSTGINLIKIAIQAICNNKNKHYKTIKPNYFSVKFPQFSHHRFLSTVPIGTVEMQSTGEVACINNTFLEAFYHAWLSTGVSIKHKRLLVYSQKKLPNTFFNGLLRLQKTGWEIFGTPAITNHIKKHAHSFHKVELFSGGNNRVEILIKEQSVDLVFLIPENPLNIYERSKLIDDAYLARLAINHNVPIVTNVVTAEALIDALVLYFNKKIKPKLLNSFHSTK